MNNVSMVLDNLLAKDSVRIYINDVPVHEDDHSNV